MKAIIEVFNNDGFLSAIIDDPKTFEIYAPFGAEKAYCNIELYNRDKHIQLDYGYLVTVNINGYQKFKGEITEIRTDTFVDALSFHAEREPVGLFYGKAEGLYLNSTPTDILKSLLNNQQNINLIYNDVFPSYIIIDKLEFHSIPIFYAVDLLAKLSGNYIWDISWNNELRFRPFSVNPDHVFYFDERWHELKIWESDEYLKNVFDFYGGLADDNEFYRFFVHDDSLEKFGQKIDTLFVRAISTQQAFNIFSSAILMESPNPAFEKYVDFYKPCPAVSFGDTIMFRNANLPYFGANSVFRVKAEQIRIDSKSYTSRLHLARGFESSTRYLFYVDHDPAKVKTEFVSRRTGSFRLDYSALDSQSHLDD